MKRTFKILSLVLIFIMCFGVVTAFAEGKTLSNDKFYAEIPENFEINEQFDIAYNEDDLWDLEDMYICIYNTLDDRYGYNKRRSGSKHKGHGKPSEESRRKNSDSQKALYEQGYVNPMCGQHHTEETKHKISEKQSGKKASEKTKRKMSEAKKGISKSEEHKRKIGQAHKGKKRSDEAKHNMSKNHADFKGKNNPGAKKVICLEKLYLSPFDTIAQAAEWAGLKNPVSICNCCKGKQKTAGGYHWMYYTDYLLDINNKNEQLIA